MVTVYSFILFPLIYFGQVWVLDATPGKVRAGRDGEDHPAELISFLSKLPKEVSFYFLMYFVIIYKLCILLYNCRDIG